MPQITYAEGARVLRVGYFEFPGYHELNEDGSRSGYGYELLQLLARYENVTYQYVGFNKSWEDMQKMLDNGEIDLVSSTRKTTDRLHKYNYSQQSVGSTSTILTVKAGNSKILSGEYNTYNGMKVGLLNGNSRNSGLSRFSDEHGFSYEPIYYDSTDQLASALQSGTVDAICTSRLRLTDDEWILDTFDEEPIYIITKKGDTEVISLVNDTLDKLNRNKPGWQLELDKKYYDTKVGQEIYLNADELNYLKKLKESGKVCRVVVNPDRYPYSFVDKNGQMRGIMVDTFKEVAQKVGLSYEIINAKTRDEYIN